MEHGENTIPVLVTMTGTSEFGDEVSLSTDGQLVETLDGFLLQYEELHEGSDGPMVTLMDCQSDSVTIVRAQNTATTLVFRQGETFESQYHTPVGPLMLRIYSTEVSVRRRGSLGHVRLTYQVTLQSHISASAAPAMRLLDVRFRPRRS